MQMGGCVLRASDLHMGGYQSVRQAYQKVCGRSPMWQRTGFYVSILGLVEQAQTEKVGPVLRQHPPVQCHIPHCRGTTVVGQTVQGVLPVCSVVYICWKRFTKRL